MHFKATAVNSTTWDFDIQMLSVSLEEGCFALEWPKSSAITVGKALSIVVLLSVRLIVSPFVVDFKSPLKLITFELVPEDSSANPRLILSFIHAVSPSRLLRIQSRNPA